MKKFRYLIIICLSGLLIFNAFGQTNERVTIEGFIFAVDTGEPLPGANVSIKGTNFGAATSLEGKFTIEYTANKEFTLVVTFMGYKRQEKTFFPGDDVANLRFDLEINVFMGQEVVVTGIASKRSKDIAEVAVARIKATELTEVQAYQDLSQLVTAKIPGVRIESSSGNVGSGIRFNMRSGGGLNGNEQPVIYIDGVRMDSEEYEGTNVGGQGISLLADLNPEDIENIDILKGPAAAASYGTSGSNGVVIITTKRGRFVTGKGRKVKINYKMVTGANTQAYNYSPDEFVNASRMDGTHHTGQISQHSLTASGGTDILKYYLGFDRRYEEGLLVNNHLGRTTMRANFDVYPNEDLSLSASANYSRTENRRPEGDNNSYSWIGQTYKDNPPYPSIDSLSITKINNTININRFIGSVQARWTPLMKGFEIGATIGVDEYDLIDFQVYPFGYYISGHTEGSKSILNRQNSQFTYQLDAQYSFRPLEGLVVNSMVGAQVFDRRIKGSSLSKEYFETGLISNVGAGDQFQGGDEYLVHYREAGIFTEHSLTYMAQYYLSFMVRKDYASTVGKEAPSIIYPRASFAIRMDKYDFFPSLFTMMKLRAAYGETGVLPGRRDAVRLLWDGDNSAYGLGADISRIGNEALKPERVKELEFGFDSEISNNVSVEFTYYRQNAKESIVGFWNPPSTGKTSNSIPSNIGSIKGWGIESLIQARVFSSNNFQLDLSLTNSYQTNEVVDMGGAQPIIGGRSNVIMEGYEKHAFYNYKVIGAIFNEDGTYNGAELAEEKSYLGNPIPPYTGSFSLNTRLFKNFNISVLMDWATGFKIFNYTQKKAGSYYTVPRQRELMMHLGMDSYFNAPDYYKGQEWIDMYNSIERYTVGSPEYIAAAHEFAQWTYEDAPYIEPADYLKLREISVSYKLTDLMKKFLGDRLISDLVVGFSARNVWRTTKYSGPCVELNSSGARSSSRGLDFYTLQLPRVLNFWVNISL